MSHFYFDSSALVKRYVVETGTSWVNSLIYDSVQLAAALELQTVRVSLSLSTITFVCADDQLNITAMAEGF